MIAPIEDNRDAIVALCRQYGVQRLAVFGSAVKGTFDPATSDLDFVVDFLDYGPGVSLRFTGFAHDMEFLFRRSVDLVFDAKLTNPYFRRAVDSSRELVYDASRDSQAAA